MRDGDWGISINTSAITSSHAVLTKISFTWNMNIASDYTSSQNPQATHNQYTYSSSLYLIHLRCVWKRYHANNSKPEKLLSVSNDTRNRKCCQNKVGCTFPAVAYHISIAYRCLYWAEDINKFTHQVHTNRLKPSTSWTNSRVDYYPRWQVTF